MGTVFKQYQADEKKPSAPPKVSYKDEVNGVEQVPVTNADGSITYVTRKLPLSEEEQRKKSELDKMADDALAEIKLLTSEDYIASESTQKLLNDWQAGQQEILNESFDDRKESEADKLAKRGLSDSTAARTVTRQTKQDEFDANKQVDRERSLMANNIRQNELNNQQNLYNLAQNQLNYDQAQIQKSANANLSKLGALNTANTASLNDYYNRKLSSSNQSNMFLNNILGPVSQQAGSTASGALDKGVGGFISTITLS